MAAMHEYLTVRVPSDTARAIRRAAKQDQRTIASYLRMVIAKALDLPDAPTAVAPRDTARLSG